MADSISVDWDYTRLAAHYEHRPPYAPAAIEQMIEAASLQQGDEVCDIGAGTGHLTVELLSLGLQVTAIEPNSSMRGVGIKRTLNYPKMSWVAAAGEVTGLPEDRFRLASFGSSFNVVRQLDALKEANRILRPDGWFACLWNHRDLDDPLQAEIEAFIRRILPAYTYGVRREDPTGVIMTSGLFTEPVYFEATVRHLLPATVFSEGWRSHATLQRQAGERFGELVSGIDGLIKQTGQDDITVPYTTRVWMASCG